MGISFVLLAVLIYVQPLAAAFGLAPLDWVHWLYLTALAPLYLACEELRKIVAKRYAGGTGRALTLPR